MGLFDIFKKSSAEPQLHPLEKAVREGGFEIQNFAVEENNGIVTVSGLVEDGSDVGRVTRLLKNQTNVRRVINEMDVIDVSDRNQQYRVNIRVKYLNVRLGPGPDHEVIGRLENKDEVLLVKKISRNWLMIRKDKLEGYCNAKYLKPLS